MTCNSIVSLQQTVELESSSVLGFTPIVAACKRRLIAAEIGAPTRVLLNQFRANPGPGLLLCGVVAEQLGRNSLLDDIVIWFQYNLNCR
jgi:hypothetical protein